VRTATSVPVRHPIRDRLPGIYVDNGFALQFTAALDEVLAPVIAVLDGFADYLDPSLAPEDFLDWLTSWVALDADESWTAGQRRELIRYAVRLHRWRGTRWGLETQVRLLTGGEAQVLDSGGCVSSPRPNGPLPGTEPANVRVRVNVADPSTVDQSALRAVVADIVPAHVAVTVEIVTEGAST
jgi:phage tail-like protein